MKKYFYKSTLIAIGIVIGIICFSCENDYLNRIPLDQPSSDTFLKNETELNAAVNLLYRVLYGLDNDTNLQLHLDEGTDISWMRGDYGLSINTIGQGNTTPSTSLISSCWSLWYNNIGKANIIINNKEKSLENGISESAFLLAEAQARFFRAYSYSNLTEYYGDVPLVTKTLGIQESKDAIRNLKAEVVAQIMEDLDFASKNLPISWDSKNNGRITKGAALGLMSRVALYNKDYVSAAQYAQKVMDLKVYALYPNYENLFQYEGVGNSETMLKANYLTEIKKTSTARTRMPRNVGGWSLQSPSVFLVDSYECIDGLPIDKSPLYDDSKPYKNRDPRLKMSIIMPESNFAGIVFETHPDSIKTTKYSNGVASRIANQEILNPYATFTGYLWRKYASPNDVGRVTETTMDVIYMRYAEILLIYAEAKIESGTIDDSVLKALNAVRGRVNMPAITTTNQIELRKIVRNERKVELASEGFRMIDIRRWGIGAAVMNGSFPGRKLKARWYTPGIPTINANGHPVYKDFNSVFSILEPRSYKDSNNLWPIPQSEMDLFPKWKQNP